MKLPSFIDPSSYRRKQELARKRATYFRNMAYGCREEIESIRHNSPRLDKNNVVKMLDLYCTGKFYDNIAAYYERRARFPILLAFVEESSFEMQTSDVSTH